MSSLLLLSNSSTAGKQYLEHARPVIGEFIGSGVKSMAFVPYAAVQFSYDEYERRVAEALPDFDIVSVHHSADPVETLAACDAVAVGGGNTFKLVHDLYESGLMTAIMQRVEDGMQYIGWSAGSNVACPALVTTNDMPIIEPPSFRTLGLVPFQINPHYLDAHPDGHMGETREDRIREYVLLNPGTAVVGLREGSWLIAESGNLVLGGNRPMRLFRSSELPTEIEPGSDLSFLM
jgi:dipeptidase E